MAFQPTQRSGSMSPRQFGDEVKTGVTNYVKNEMLGIDDFGSSIKHAKEGNIGGAIKSGLTGLGEIALTVASVGVGTGVKAAAKPAVKAAIKKATTRTAAVQATKKAETTAAKPNKFFDDVLPDKPKATKADDGYPVKPKVDEKPKPGAKPGKKPSKLGRAAAFGAGYALGKDNDSSDPSKWKASAVV